MKSEWSPVAEAQSLMNQVIAPSFSVMLRAGECTTLTLEVHGITDLQQATLRAEINAEEFVSFLAVPGQVQEPAKQRRVRLMNELQDFIAEGTRTWGEYRPIATEPPWPDAHDDAGPRTS